MENFTRSLRSSTVARVCFHAFYRGSTELYGWSRVFSAFYKDSTELYGCSRVVSCILQRLYGALQVLASVFVHFTRTLRSSTVARVCFRAFCKDSTELNGRLCVFSAFYKDSAERHGRSLVVSAVYKDSTELYGCSHVFPCILQGLYRALRAFACVSSILQRLY